MRIIVLIVASVGFGFAAFEQDAGKPAAAVPAISTAPAPAEGPVTSFEADSDNPFKPAGFACTRVAENASDGKFALKVEVKGSDKPTWPGIILPGGAQPNWSQRRFLNMDIFLAGTEPLHLAARLDSEGREGAFGSVPGLHPGWNRNVGIAIPEFASSADLERVKSLLIYAGQPKKDATFYLDNVRWTQAFKPFKPIVYVETLPKPVPTADEATRGFIAYSRHYLRLTFENSRPESRVADLRLFAAQGEKEPVTVNVYALRDLAGVTAAVSDLTGPAGAVLPAASWDVRFVKYLNKRINYQSDQYYVNAPAYLAAAAQPVAVAADRSCRFWFTLTVPESAKPGVYRGSVRIAAGAVAQDVPVAVRVLPFKLPEPKGLLYGQYYRLFGRHADLKARVRADMADMRIHGMTSIGLCIGIDAKSYAVAGENVTFTFDGSTPFEWCLDAYKELGYPEPIILLSDSGQEAAAKAGKPKTPEYEHAYVNFHKALAAAAKDKGWPVIYVQPVDEPSWQDQESKERNTYLLKLLKAGGVLTEEDGPGDDYFHTDAGPYSDIWNYNGIIGTPEQRAQAVRDGRIVTVYNYDVECYLGECDRWACGYFTWRHGLRGTYNWEYRGGSGSLYDDLDSQYGDFPHDYLPEKDQPGGPSVGWEATREGIDDRRYLALCEDLIARAKAKGGQAAECAATVERGLAELRDWLDAGLNSSRVNVEPTQLLTEDQAQPLLPADVPAKVYKYVGGELKFTNNVALAEYDTIRWIAASHALALMQALGEGTGTSAAAAFTPTPVPERVVVAGRESRLDLTRMTRPSLRVPMLKAAPIIDGDIATDPAWQDAATTDLVRSDGSGKPEMPTLVRCVLSGDTLYVGIVCHEESIGKLTANVTQPNGPVWEDDCVEIFLDPGLTGKEYYQVLVNPLGTVAIAGTHKDWKPDVQAKAKVDSDRKEWTVELAIPITGMTLAPRFGLNFGRERRPLDSFELSTWSPTGGAFGKPERFGIAVAEGDLPQAEVVKPALKLAVSPRYVTLAEAGVQLRFDVTFGSADPAKTSLAVTVTGGAQPITATVPPPLDNRVAVRLAVGDLPAGAYTVETRLVGAATEPATAGTFQRLAGPVE